MSKKVKQEELVGMPDKTELAKQCESLIEAWEELQEKKDKVAKIKDLVLEAMEKEKKYKITIDKIVIEYKESKEGVTVKREPNRE